jgi:hypothetical protein
VNYKAYYGLSCFRPLLRGNSATSSDFILKMNGGYKWGEQRARQVHEVKREMILLSACLKGRGPFIDWEVVG